MRDEAARKLIKIGFWKVAGLISKDRQFWEFVEELDVIGMVETWVDDKKWNKLKEKLPQDYKWKCQFAKKEKSKGTAKGGIITGVKKDIKEEEVMDKVKNIQERRLRIDNEI